MPKFAGDRKRIDIEIQPPGDFVAGLMKLAVMDATQWHGEFIADFSPHCARLCKAQMMGIGGCAPTNQARLCCNKSQVGRIPAAKLPRQE